MKKVQVDKTLLLKCYQHLSIYQMMYPETDDQNVLDTIVELEQLIQD